MLYGYIGSVWLSGPLGSCPAVGGLLCFQVGLVIPGGDPAFEAPSEQQPVCSEAGVIWRPSLP